MTGNNSYREKGRAVFLAAIMVLSVVAMSATFAGAAAAEVTSADRTIEDAELEPGESTVVTVVVELDDGEDPAVFEEFDPAFDEVEITDLDPFPEISAVTDANDGLTVVWEGDQEEVLVEYEVTVPEDAEDGDEFTFSGDADDADSEVTIEGDDTITVATDDDDDDDENGDDENGDDENGADNGDDDNGDEETPDDVDADVTVDHYNDLEGQLVFAGQDVAVGGFDADQQVQLRNSNSDGDDEGFATNIRANDDGVILIDTEDRDGYYILTAPGIHAGPFEVTEQDVSFAFEDDEVRSGHSTTLNFEDDNRGADVDILIDADGDLDEDELADIFAGATAYDDDEVLIENVAEGDEIDADFDGIDAGEYEFTVSIYDTTGEDTAEIEILDVIDVEPRFDANVYESAAGDVVSFKIVDDGGDELTELEELFINVSSEEEDIHVGYISIDDVSAGDDVGENITVEINTYLAGQDDDAAVTVLNSEGEDITDDVGVSADFSFALDDEPLPVVDYELELYEEYWGDDEVDAAFLMLEEGEISAVNTWVAPEDGDLEDAEDDLAEFLEDATERDYVAENDLLITEVEATGVFGYLIDDYELQDDVGIEMTYEMDADSPFRSDDAFDVVDAQDDLTVVPDADNGVFYVILDTSGSFDGATFDGGDEQWEVTVEVTEENVYIDDEDDEYAVSDAFDVEERALEIVGYFDEDDNLLVPNSEDAQIVAETNVAPNTEADFTIRFPTSVERADGYVDADGLVSATFDFSDRDAGDEIRRVNVEEAGGEEDTVSGLIVDDEEPVPANFQIDADAPASVDVDDAAALDVTVTNAGEESDEQSIVVTIGGDEVYNEAVELDDGESWADSFDLDTSEAGEIDWSVETDNDSASGTVEVVKEEEPAPPEEEEEEEEEPAPPEEEEEEEDVEPPEEEEEEEDEDAQPGFGVAVALVALLAAAMLALRRQD